MVYLLHFDRGYKHARHYLGATSDPAATRQLAAGIVPELSVPLLDAARREGVTFHVEQTWPGDERELMRRRNLGGAARFCRRCARERHGATL